MENNKLQVQTNLNKSLQQLNRQECEDDIKQSLVIVMERLKMDFDSIDETINDLLDEFKHVTIKDIREALRGGGLGKYGRTYKLSTQEISIWIREYLKSKKSKLL